MSCGSRKVVIDNENITIKKDSLFTSKIKTISINQNNISITEFFDELEIIPIDTTRAILVDGKIYKNVKIKKKKKITETKDTTKKESIKDEKLKLNIKSEEKKVIKKKNIDKKESLSFKLFLLASILIFLFYPYKRRDKTLF